MTVVKAYKNEDFLMSEAARPVRILCEYLEPARRFEQLGVRNTVIFFGSARLKPLTRLGADYYAAAADLAERLARWTWDHHAAGHRYHIVSGGGPGIMEAAHAGAARVDRSLNIGLNISLPFEQHINPYLDDARAVEFHYFFLRKFWFLNLARGAVIFPGGFGTLDELFELLTLTQTGKSAAMPILLYGGEFWRRLVDWDFLLERALISAEDLQHFHIVDTVDQAFEHLRNGLQHVEQA